MIMHGKIIDCASNYIIIALTVEKYSHFNKETILLFYHREDVEGYG